LLWFQNIPRIPHPGGNREVFGAQTYSPPPWASTQRGRPIGIFLRNTIAILPFFSLSLSVSFDFFVAARSERLAGCSGPPRSNSRDFFGPEDFQGSCRPQSRCTLDPSKTGFAPETSPNFGNHFFSSPPRIPPFSKLFCLPTQVPFLGAWVPTCPLLVQRPPLNLPNEFFPGATPPPSASLLMTPPYWQPSPFAAAPFVGCRPACVRLLWRLTPLGRFVEKTCPMSILIALRLRLRPSFWSLFTHRHDTVPFSLSFPLFSDFVGRPRRCPWPSFAIGAVPRRTTSNPPSLIFPPPLLFFFFFRDG